MKDRDETIGRNGHGGRTRRRIAVGVLSLVATAGLIGGVGALQASTTTADPKAPVATMHPTAAELAQWRAETATPYQRAIVVQKMQAAFAGVAQVGVGPLPSQAVTRPTTAGTGHDAQLVLAYGVSGDHFWVTASYADMARGAIKGAVAACTYYYDVPGWICNAAGSLLSSMASGWGSGNSHGVWAAVYWWPPHVTGGRW